VTGSSSLLQNPNLPVATLQEKQHENHHPETWQFFTSRSVQLLLLIFSVSRRETVKTCNERQLYNFKVHELAQTIRNTTVPYF